LEVPFTNAFSKKLANHMHAVVMFYLHYINFGADSPDLAHYPGDGGGNQVAFVVCWFSVKWRAGALR
jgi:hypothetical protein